MHFFPTALFPSLLSIVVVDVEILAPLPILMHGAKPFTTKEESGYVENER